MTIDHADGSAAARERVRARYATAAGQVRAGRTPSCSDADPAGMCGDAYDPAELAGLPGAGAAGLGCGNPLAVAELVAGETVLDLGSGAGLDVLLSARRVGPDGFAYGLDMTDEMLDLARRHAAEAGATNVEFLRGQIEAIPLPDASVDVVISNCVINLSVDKPAVFAEIARVLRPGGRVGVSDLVGDDDADPRDQARAAATVGAITGVVPVGDYRAQLERAGLTDITVTATHEAAPTVWSAIIQASRPGVSREGAGRSVS
ncbi:methyltransferase domain-containing protein [Actinomycetospora chibensis]|uniref:Arsenite methyltransferase n=1 Tax=Actinomycetospora chibensis TaxID=663606 RepID=A0ABV9RRH4_9PSEU|nr:methyltransferase domain-containing protein [Actinomycetospora chibensis]MDD7925187.1 methyltransferase domain-containing protein [Actinomycetospora chibensis]